MLEGLVKKLRSIALAKAPSVDKVSLADPGLPDWSRILRCNDELWREAKATAAAGPRVLLATAIGGHPQFTVVESALAVALTLRGVKVDVLLCDQAVSACLRAKVSAVAPTQLVQGELRNVFCGHCVKTGRQLFEGTGLDLIGLKERLSQEEEREARELALHACATDVRRFQLDGVPVGEHALAGALRYFGRGDLSQTPEAAPVLERYLESAVRTLRAAQRILAMNEYDAAIVNHGIYVPHGILATACRAAGVRVATWNLAYRKQCVIFSHDDTYHHTLMNEPTEQWLGMQWSDAHETAILRYLESRERGSRDWIWFNNKPDEDVQQFAARVGLDWRKPVIGMLTNVVWDAQLHYPANAFRSMVDWVLQTVSYFRTRPDLQLLIRVHPGELAPPGGQTVSHQPVAEIIAQAFPELPKNVFIIGPENPLSTYACAQRCNALIIYGTKAGVEFTSRGIPVIVAGEAWIRNKGLTRDVTSPTQYVSVLDELPFPARMDAATVSQARRYAYHFFFRRMIPFAFLQPRERAWPPFELAVNTPDELLPGRYPGLDVVCDGIIKRTPFVYPAERIGLHD